MAFEVPQVQQLCVDRTRILAGSRGRSGRGWRREGVGVCQSARIAWESLPSSRGSAACTYFTVLRSVPASVRSWFYEVSQPLLGGIGAPHQRAGAVLQKPGPQGGLNFSPNPQHPTARHRLYRRVAQ